MPAHNPPQHSAAPAGSRVFRASAGSARLRLSSADARTTQARGVSARGSAASVRASYHKAAAHTKLANGVPASPEKFLLRDGVFLLLLFLLLWEWVRPLPQLSHASESSIVPILLVFGLSIFLDWLQISYLHGWLIRFTALLGLIGYLFYPDIFTEFTWLQEYALLLSQDGLHIVHGNLDSVSQQSRLVLFMMGWMLMITVIGFILLQKQYALWLVAGTLLYLIALQLFQNMDTDIPIFRTVGIGILLLALLNIPKLERIYGSKPLNSVWPGRWLAASLFIAAVISGIGWIGHQSLTVKQLKPIDTAAILHQWESYLRQQPQLLNKTTATRSKSGYGEDDSSLGGRMTLDNSLIFTAQVSELANWRGESKSLYTGKGWTGTEPNWSAAQRDSAYLNTAAPAYTQEVTWNSAEPNRQIFYSGKLDYVNIMLTKEGKPTPFDFLLWDKDSGKVSLPLISDPINYYRITAHPIQKDPVLLMKDTAAYPLEITEAYLQLPPNLPPKIKQLAERIADGLDSPFAKAAAIENYLRSTYTYSLDKPTLPAANEDFVNHFLFVDQTGYCDHFSTAMVIMLRSAGIPARWVKGFAPGEVITPSQSIQSIQTTRTVEVRAKDAHSWAEVYFPSAGWIPFEPTPGFTDQSLKSLDTVVPAKVKLPAIHTVWQLPNFHSVDDWVLQHWSLLAFTAGGLLIVAIALLFMTARRRRHSAINERIRQMDRIWLKIFRHLAAKPAEQTLREYIAALKLPNGEKKRALLEFLRLYENLSFNGEERRLLSRNQIMEAWNSIKKG
ncbi:transglutaminase-like domain-containing protein [Paenibacillus sp. GP183]|uniref:transglutaminase-like domain-containing protein n=1 Tax=Paenibacillus sp. GP183 TaxID=1882751 RepID=UPI00089C8A4C|nr:transglutaminase-like domain-containing protein [Paenibacillus sp. GP183]SEC52736.1 Transglutaminase-like superfamily protein [Paenibacillus sp. GP183]